MGKIVEKKSPSGNTEYYEIKPEEANAYSTGNIKNPNNFELSEINENCIYFVDSTGSNRPI